MIYSRFLYTEFESPPHGENNEGGYTIFSAAQPHGPGLELRANVGLQRFAVLWDGTPDTRIINLIEEAIAGRVLSPIKLLHASKGCLEIIVDKRLKGEKRRSFEDSWADMASGVIMDSWTSFVFTEGAMHPMFDGGRLLRTYSPKILATEIIGITDYSFDMFLFGDDWAPENFMNDHDDAARDRPKSDDLFDSDIPF